VSAAAVIGGTRAAYRKTLGRRHVAYRRLSRLGTNAQLSFFTAVLGEPPAMRRTIDAMVTRLAEEGHRSLRQVSFVECVYIDRWFFVQTLTDSDDAVMAFSVTSRKPRFRPRLLSPGGTASPSHSFFRRRRPHSFKPFFDIHLNKSRFEQLPEPGRVVAFLGARRAGYMEGHWFGNPGHHQWYAFAMNDAAPSSGGAPGVGTIFEVGRGAGEVKWGFDPVSDPTFEKVPGVAAFRSRATINTYTVIGGWLSIDDYPTTYGPDADRVRTIP
jgi:hypothetical protein